LEEKQYTIEGWDTEFVKENTYLGGYTQGLKDDQITSKEYLGNYQV